jgi:ribosomal protein S18 acetylase RimI-like enzyme
MDLTVRYATNNDATLIADISRQTFYETFAAENRKEDMDKFLREQFTKGKLIKEVGNMENIFLLANSGDDVARYAKLREAKQPEKLKNVKTMEIARIYAMPNMIGKGVGNLLMKTSISIAKEKGKEVIWLGVWEKNIRAIDFYKKWGFEKFDVSDFLLGDDVQCDWLMKKEL